MYYTGIQSLIKLPFNRKRYVPVGFYNSVGGLYIYCPNQDNSRVKKYQWDAGKAGKNWTVLCKSRPMVI